MNHHPEEAEARVQVMPSSVSPMSRLRVPVQRGESAMGDGFIISRTERDRRPARRVRTAQLLGDPAPDRVVPDTPQSPFAARCRYDDPMPTPPINLTFAQMRAAYGETQ